jgi:hypothetical protein
MTPKEKAKELVDKFYQTTPNESWINQPIGLKEEYKAWEQSKQCALIAVGEVLNVVAEWHEINYWIEVKQEINKL